MDLLEKALQEKTTEIRQLRKQFADLEHEKHAEIVKLRLEVSQASRPDLSLFNYVKVN